MADHYPPPTADVAFGELSILRGGQADGRTVYTRAPFYEAVYRPVPPPALFGVARYRRTHEVDEAGAVIYLHMANAELEVTIERPERL